MQPPIAMRVGWAWWSATPKMALYTVIVLRDINIVDVRTMVMSTKVKSSPLRSLLKTLEWPPQTERSKFGPSLETRCSTKVSSTCLLVMLWEADDGEPHDGTVHGRVVDLRIRYTNASPERTFGNNLLSFSVVVNAPPSIEDVYCSAAFLSRGAYTICSVEATDDRTWSTPRSSGKSLEKIRASMKAVGRCCSWARSIPPSGKQPW